MSRPLVDSKANMSKENEYHIYRTQEEGIRGLRILSPDARYPRPLGVEHIPGDKSYVVIYFI